MFSSRNSGRAGFVCVVDETYRANRANAPAKTAKNLTAAVDRRSLREMQNLF